MAPNGTGAALELTQSNGKWVTPAQAALPGTALSPELSSVACPAVGTCLATGKYTTATSGENGTVIAGESGDTWSVAALPQAATYNVEAADSAQVACAAGGYCAISGYTANASTGRYVAFLLDAPATVTTPAATVTGTTANVTWGAPADDGGLPVTGYSVTANDLTDAARGGQTVTTGASVTSATFSGLTPGDSYTFTVGDQSLLGNGLTATTASVSVALPAGSGGGAGTGGGGSTAGGGAGTTQPGAGTIAPQTPIATVARTALLASLGSLLRPSGRTGRLRAILRAGGHTFTYRGLESGRIVVRWYRVSGHGRHRRRQLVASGSAHMSGADRVHVRVRLTAFGRRLLRHPRRVRLISVVHFTPSGGRAVTRTRAFTLH